MPPSAEPVAGSSTDKWMPNSAEPVQQPQAKSNPIISALTQPLAQTLTGKSMQNRIMDISGTPIPSYVNRPFDAGVQIGSNPLFRANDIAQKFVGGMVGNLADQVTTPSNLMLGAVLSKGAGMLANNPITRRFLQTQLPTLSTDLLAANPMEPIYKTINGIQADITKPLPPSAPRLVQIGTDLKDSIQQAIDTLGAKYKPLVGENPLTPDEVLSALPEKVATKLGIDLTNIKTTADLWQARTDLRTTIPDNSFDKGEFFKNNNLKEKDVMDMMDKMKALVMNKMSPADRDSLDVLDNHYGNAIGAGKSLIKSIYNPNSGEVKTDSLMKLFTGNQGKQDLINKLNYFNSNVGKFSKQVINHVNTQARNQMIGKVAGYGALGLGGTALANKFLVQPAIKGFQEATDTGGDANGQ